MAAGAEPVVVASRRSDGAVRRLSADLLDAADARLGEGPGWDATLQHLVWVDILSGRVHLSDAGGGRLATFDVGGHVGAAMPSRNGGWLLATRAGFGLLDEDGICRPLLDVHGDDGVLRFNDAKCDPDGRAVAGTMRYDEAGGSGTLYRLDPGPVAFPLLRGQGLCNGLGWSPDGQLLYFVDSLTHAIAIYRYDPRDGSVDAVGELVRLDRALGMPDGLCVDDDGGVWVAMYGGGTVRRHRPDGELDVVVELPVRYPTSVAFGGPDGDRLFITTGGGSGRAGGGRDRYDAGGETPGAGGLWAVDPGVTGPPATPWRPLPAAPTARTAGAPTARTTGAPR